MSEEKIKLLKEKFGNNENKTSRNNDVLKVALDRYTNLGEAIQSWKRITYLLFTFCLILIGLTTYIFTQKQIYPYIVKVNENTGEVISSQVIVSNNIDIGEKEREYFIKKFIIDSRTIITDEKHYLETLQKINYFLTSETQKKLSDTLSLENVNELLKKDFTKSVEIISLTKTLDTKNNYQLRWRERTFDDKGSLVKRRNFLALIQIDYFKPDLKTIEFNPLGIIISDFNITQEN